jgi:hypothetical protein
LCGKFQSFDNNINLPYDDFESMLDWISLFNSNQNNKLYNISVIAIYNYGYEYEITILPKDYTLDNLNNIINTLELFFDDKKWLTMDKIDYNDNYPLNRLIKLMQYQSSTLFI